VGAALEFDQRLRDGISSEDVAVLGDLLGRLERNVADHDHDHDREPD
jgi:hypothetical protein